MTSKIKIYYHIWAENNYKSVFEAHMDHIKNSGLLDHVDSINVGVISKTDITDYLEKFEKVNILYLHSANTYEAKTLKHLYEDCCNSNEDFHTLYFHTKGVSRPKNEYVKDWNNMMTYFMVDKWKDCIKELEEYDTVGCNLSFDNEKGKRLRVRHFSGNFWWANSDYIKKLNLGLLTKRRRGYTKRHSCEFWVLSNNDAKYKSIHNSGSNHYKSPYSLKIYTK